MGLRVRTHQEHGRSPLLFVVCCVRSGIIDEMIARPIHFYHYLWVCVCVFLCGVVCVCVCVWCVCLIVCDLETSKKDGLGLNWAAVQQKTNFNRN